MKHGSYIVVSPMKNEENYVRYTLDSMVSQTLRPSEWLIVNDGSTDRSAEIVASYAERYSWIRLVNVEGLGERLPAHYGGHVVDLIHEGLRQAQAAEYDFIVKVDCDISFDSQFFETVFECFHSNPRLGITSGLSYLIHKGVMTREKTADAHTLGATKVYRKACFRDIGGLVPSMGWDGIDEIKARMKGWEARPIDGLQFVHHRPEGMALGLLASGVERGKGSYFMGYHPVFMLMRACFRMLQPHMFADGIGLLAGYFVSVWRCAERIPDTEFIQFLRRQQLRKLFLRRSEV